jgi:ABC-2 type transport system permease protein
MDIYQTLENKIKQSKENSIKLSIINPDSSLYYQQALLLRDTLSANLAKSDSLYQVYQYLRKITFLKKNLKKPERERRLAKYYKPMIDSKEKKLFYEKELLLAEEELDEAFIIESKSRANHLLKEKKLDAFIFLPAQILDNDPIEYHSLRPGHFLIKEKFQEILDNIILEQRLMYANIKKKKSDEILKKVSFVTYQLKGDEIEKSDTLANYYGPIIALFLMFLSVFTSSGHLFSSFVNEKNNRILEFILGTCSKHQLFFSKIIGSGLLGFLQIIIWLIIFLIISQFSIFKLTDISYLTWMNFLYYLIYYILAYLLFACILAGISVIFVSENEANNLNQSIRIIAILPILFALFVLENPNSEFIRALSFIPFLSPSFMIMRIPLSSELPVSDIQETILILILSILFFYILSFRLFKAAAVYYGKRPSFLELFSIIKNGQI